MIKKGISLLLVLIAFLPVSAQNSLHVQLLFNWQDLTLPASSTWNNAYNEVWGYAKNGREYAIIGSTMGTHIFDITDPANGHMVDYIPGAAQGNEIVHRDYHDYAGYLYMVCDEGSSTLQIADLSYLPDSVSVVYDSDALLMQSHNIFIDTASARLYACGVRNASSVPNDLEIYSLADPENPVEIAVYNGYDYFHDIYVQNDTAFGNCGGSGLLVADFSDAGNPQILGNQTFYSDRGYNHSGWATPDLQTYFLADENHGLEIKSFDISDLSDIRELAVFGSGVHMESIPHNLMVHDGFLYVSYYHDGLYIFDVHDPAHPSIAGYYDTHHSGHTSFEGAWGVYPFLPSGVVLISDMQTGLYVFDVAQALDIKETNFTSGPDFKIVHHPSATLISLLSLDATGDFDIAVTDVWGRTILRTHIFVQPGDIRELKWPAKIASNVYFISVRKDGYLQTENLVKF